MPPKESNPQPAAPNAPAPSQPELNFGAGGHVAVAGTISGVVLALGGTWLVLAYGPALGLGTSLLSTLVIVALAMGAGVSIVSAFFGLVMPRHMHGPWLDPAHWERMAERKRRWRDARRRMRWAIEDGREGYDEEGPEDLKPPRRRRS